MPRLQCSVVGVTKGLQNVCVISPSDSNFLLQPTRGCKTEIGVARMFDTSGLAVPPRMRLVVNMEAGIAREFLGVGIITSLY